MMKICNSMNKNHLKMKYKIYVVIYNNVLQILNSTNVLNLMTHKTEYYYAIMHIKTLKNLYACSKHH